MGAPELADPLTPDPPLGDPSGFTCPECHGALWELDDGTLPRFRCRVGHGFSADNLLVHQRGDVEAALWTAYRALEERAALCRGLAERARCRSAAITAEHFRVEADEMACRRSAPEPAKGPGRRLRRRCGRIGLRRRNTTGGGAAKSVTRANDQDDYDEPKGDGPAEETTLTSADRDDFERLLEYLKRSRGFDFTGYKRASLVRRFGKRMEARRRRHATPSTSTSSRSHPDEFTALFNTILINVTGFFRDPAAWELLCDAMCSRACWPRKGPPEPIRVWSAGCATGEEAYTLAIAAGRAARGRRGAPSG